MSHHESAASGKETRTRQIVMAGTIGAFLIGLASGVALAEPWDSAASVPLVSTDLMPNISFM